MIPTDAKAVLFSLLDPALSLRTRSHAFGAEASERLYVKREDELSSGISGSKLRKYASLAPELARRGVTDIALIGGPNSNNLVGALQFLKNSGIRPWLFIREAADTKPGCNAILIDMLADPAFTTTIARADWPQAETIAAKTLREEGISPDGFYVLPEGGLCFESLLGSLTLAEDVLRNEFEESLHFDRIYVDSGSGMSAIGLIIGLALFAPSNNSREVVVTLLAGSEAIFENNLRRFYATFLEKERIAPSPLPAYRFLRPPTAQSYGSVNASVLDQCRSIARTHGVLMDPVYSAKHYMAMREDLRLRAPAGDSLFVFNGSPLGLCGFLDRLTPPPVASAPVSP